MKNQGEGRLFGDEGGDNRGDTGMFQLTKGTCANLISFLLNPGGVAM